MLKKTMTYTDWNGTEVTEDFYFNLTRTEIMEMEYSGGPGETLTDKIQGLANSNDMGAIIKIVKDILLKSYGKKSDDGKRFIKNADVAESFEQSPVFDILYMELATNPEYAAEFLSGIMPTSVTVQLGDNPKEALLAKMKEFGKQE